MNKSNEIKTVLFDLDGTLLDTAPDFIFALNNLLSTKGRPAKPAEEIRNAISGGSAGLIQLGFDLEVSDQDFEPLRQELLDIYSQNLTRFTQPFVGIEDVLQLLAEKQIHWGVVTNKPAWLTIPLLEQMKLIPPPTVVVSGDTIAKTKPDPAPLLHALEKIGTNVANCIFVGDAEIDVKAGKSAGITTIVAEYGYISNPLLAQKWRADAYIKSPLDLLPLLEYKNNLESEARP